MAVGASRWPLPPGAALGAAWGAVVLLWLADAAGHGLPAAIDRLAVALALALTAALAARAALRHGWRGGWAGRALLVVVAVAVALCFLGLDHEVAGRDFGDEGIYRAHAERINGEGQLLRPWFVYPHLLFYLDALALWAAGLFRPVVAALAALLYGVEEEVAVSVLVTRAVTATLGALLPIPVFVVARRAAGDVAAVAAATLAAVSLLVVEEAHLNLSDVPAAVFAALTVMQASALLDRERTRDYLLAGLWAGLAAGSKYPAGLAALAIVALWLRWRLRERRWGWGLLWASAASVAAFLATTPSLLAFSGAVFGGETDVLFGFRQYAYSGWTGVVRGSNALYYGDLLAANFGLPAIVLGLAGAAGLSRRELSRLAWLLAFPVLYVALLLALEVAVPRNLLPAVPFVAVALGCGIAGGWRLLTRTGRLGRLRVPAAVVLAAAILVPPVIATASEVVRLSRPTTREEAAAWIEASLPPGSFFVQEAYTPRLSPEWRFPARHPRFAVRLAREELEDPAYDFLFLAGGSYNRFLRPRNLDDPALEAFAERYREIFARYELVREWAPGRWQGGSELRLYRLDPDPVPWRARRAFAPEAALLSSPEMAPSPEDPAIRYVAPEQWSLFKEYLAAGRYRVRVASDAPAGRIEIRDRTNRRIAEAVLAADGTAEVEIPARDKVFLYVVLPPPARLTGVRIVRLAAEGAQSR